MKPPFQILAIAGLFLALSIRLSGESNKSAIEVRRITPADSEISEEWVRVTTEEDILGIDATRSKRGLWKWNISIYAAEFVREDALANRLDKAVTSAIRSVLGVKLVAHEDREVWILQGDPKGDDLVRACAVAIDQLAPEIRKQIPPH